MLLEEVLNQLARDYRGMVQDVKSGEKYSQEGYDHAVNSFVEAKYMINQMEKKLEELKP